jgi:hypothetical protein
VIQLNTAQMALDKIGKLEASGLGLTVLDIPVRPGDLITADFVNQILAKLNSLEARVVALEAVLPASDAVAITSLIPDGPLQIGQELQVLGRNFGHLAGATRVTFDSVPTNAFKVGTSDQRLIFNVPAVPNNFPPGKLVSLVVTNLRTSAERTVFLLAPTNQGSIAVTWIDVQPTTITPGNAATFRYHIRSRTTETAIYALTAELRADQNSQAWQQSQLAFLDSSQNPLPRPEIQLAAGQELDFFVRISAVPQNTNNTTFTLTTTARAGSIVGTDSRSFVVGQAVVPDDPNIIASTPTVIFKPAGANLDLSTNPPTIQLPRAPADPVNNGMRIGISFALHAKGTYDVTTRISSGTNWSSTLTGADVPATFDVPTADEINKQPFFIVQALAGASGTGEVEFTVQQRGTPKGRTVRLLTALI